MGKWRNFKRRCYAEYKGIRAVMKYKKTKRAVKVGVVGVEVIRCIYNPWRLLDIFVFSQLKKSITYSI